MYVPIVEYDALIYTGVCKNVLIGYNASSLKLTDMFYKDFRVY